jgi:invasion protein IalB
MMSFSSTFKRPVLRAGLLVLVLSIAYGSDRGAEDSPKGLSVPNFHLVGTAVAQSGGHAPVPSTFSETYGDWIARCVMRETADGQNIRQCSMEQQLTWHDEESRQTQSLLTVTLTPPQANGAAITILTPFGLLLDRGIELQIDTDQGFRLPFRTCLSVGCLAQGQLAEEILGQLRAGELLTARMVESTGKQLFQIQISLKGFTAASVRLEEAVAQ